MSKVVETYYLVDKNGEVIDETREDEVFTKLRTGDVVFRKDGIDTGKKLVSINMRFKKVNSRAFKTIIKKYPIFADMMDYIQYQSGKLVYPNGVNVNRRNLTTMCGVCRNTVDKQLAGLIKDDVIKSVKDGRNVIYYVNPYVVHIGRKVYQSLVDMFSETKYSKEYNKTIEGVKNERVHGNERT